ncbi:MAG: peptidylprolyl isomerase [Pseudohongiella sp.]|nr:peptidylprolyl isomerase [Pseudohongiella sp.]
MFFRKQPLFYSLLCLLVLAPTFSWAGTVVRVNSQLGEFFIELSDDTTPITANNFLSYVNEGLYNGTVIHRLVPGFVFQGGWLKYNEAIRTFAPITTKGNIQNEFRVSNQRGTIAMAKVGGDPNSANSQWFINLGNNSFLDTDNGGFTVFGRVMGNGMQVVDAIAALPALYVLQGMDPFPLINYVSGPLLNSHLVTMNMSVAGKTDGPPAVFKPETGRMNIFVDAGALGLLAVEFELISEVPEIKVKIDPAKMFPIDRRVDTMPVFDNATGRLTIPELRVNGEVAYRNVRFMLTDGEQLVFTLEGTD